MDKHWKNLLIDKPKGRHYGNTIQSKAHHDPKRADEDARAKEMGQAFCDRARVNMTGVHS
jgi:hypothetical protein